MSSDKSRYVLTLTDLERLLLSTRSDFVAQMDKIKVYDGALTENDSLMDRLIKRENVPRESIENAIQSARQSYEAHLTAYELIVKAKCIAQLYLAVGDIDGTKKDAGDAYILVHFPNMADNEQGILKRMHILSHDIMQLGYYYRMFGQEGKSSKG